MSPFQFSLIATSSISLMLGFFIYVNNRRSAIAQAWFTLLAAVGFWALALFWVISSETESNAILWQYLVDIAGIFIPFTFVYFTIIFLNQAGGKRFLTAAAFVLALAIMFLSLTPFYKMGMGDKLGFFWVIPGSLYWIFPVYFVLSISYGFWLLIQGYRVADAKMKIHIKHLGIGNFLALAGGATNFLPQYFDVFPIGNYLILIYAVFTSYAIIRYELFDVRLIASQVFSALLVVALLFQFFGSTSLGHFLFNGAILIIAFIFSFFLVRSVWREIGQRRKIEELAVRLQASNEELKKLDQAKSEFISLASHQLRTPLTVIRGYLSMVFEESFGPVSGELKKPLTNVMLSAEQLIRLVNDLLDLSRIEAGRIQYEMAAFPVADMVEKVVTALSGAARQRGIEMQFVNSAPHRLVSADFTKLSSAVMNIVDNAVKHSQARHIEITLQEKATEGIIDISVRDDGIGIATEDLPKLFGKFSHIGNKSRYERVTGLGIGLYFTKKVVEDHRGRVWAESAGPGKGSTFHVELPVMSKAANR